MLTDTALSTAPPCPKPSLTARLPRAQRETRPSPGARARGTGEQTPHPGTLLHRSGQHGLQASAGGQAAAQRARDGERVKGRLRHDHRVLVATAIAELPRPIRFGWLFWEWDGLGLLIPRFHYFPPLTCFDSSSDLAFVYRVSFVGISSVSRLFNDWGER